MTGEILSTSEIGQNGLWGDRGYAIIDKADGKVATAKNPKKWPSLLNYQATIKDLASNNSISPVTIKFPDGTLVSSDQSGIDEKLSQAFGREVFLARTESGKIAGVQSPIPDSWTASSEEYNLDLDGRVEKESVTDFELPEGTFFDAAKLHLLTTSTLSRLSEIYPEGEFNIQRFRPNIVVETIGTENSFVENEWIGHTLVLGNEVRLKVTEACPRCVMTTLGQGDLPKDTGILRTAAQHNQGYIGVYATVVQSGKIKQGDSVRLEKG
ncbi:MAG: MOSC domain-containing protein [Candidatus Nitronauta litoralis]|uniref:MOSC domain-containing protein n=1 Tax=Candidatus Nitronauta litoralis TaxID=2705533 RepID=A0A7T0BZE1_9BACT|nr:MAG: MOSC domain-containing protein [Candidatus Nitronauta litoralis]